MLLCPLYYSEARAAANGVISNITFGSLNKIAFATSNIINSNWDSNKVKIGHIVLANSTLVSIGGAVGGGGGDGRVNGEHEQQQHQYHHNLSQQNRSQEQPLAVASASRTTQRPELQLPLLQQQNLSSLHRQYHPIGAPIHHTPSQHSYQASPLRDISAGNSGNGSTWSSHGSSCRYRDLAVSMRSLHRRVSHPYVPLYFFQQ